MPGRLAADNHLTGGNGDVNTVTNRKRWLQRCKQVDMADVCLTELINDWITRRITRVKGKSLQNALLIAATSQFPKLPRLVNLIHSKRVVHLGTLKT